MKKIIEQPNTSEAPVLEMARSVLGSVKEVEMSEEQKTEIMELIDQAIAKENAKDLAGAIKLLNQVKKKMEKLQKGEKAKENLEYELNLKEQYEEQVQTLKEVGILKKLENGDWGIIDILGQEQSIPSYDQILKRMEAKAEMIDKKREQGFTHLLLVPIGIKLSEITEKAGELIVKKHQEGNLKGTDGTALELDEDQPVYEADEYKDADVNGDLVYYPQKFDQQEHGGKTKEELITEDGAWQIIMIEDMPDLPVKGKGLEIGGRKQPEAGQSPEEYLTKIQTEDQYANEQFTTPEAQLIYFMEYLQRNNKVIDDWDGNGKGCWNAGAYFKGVGLVPYGYWVRNDRRVSLVRSYPGSHGGDRAVRPLVII